MKRSLFPALLAIGLVQACAEPTSTPSSRGTGSWSLAGPEGGLSTSGWTSSGGEIAGDTLNPWWIENTAEVRYCVETDAATVSVGVDAIEAGFRAALSYWQGHFVGAEGIKVASQTFTRAACGEADVALKIQAGTGTLDALQQDFLGTHLPRIVGVAVRTAYDRVEMRATGFVYLRSDIASGGTWSDPRRLNHVLVHELGHVFGVPHLQNTIMDEGAPEHWYDHALNHDLPVPIRRMPDAVTVDSYGTGLDFASSQGDVVGRERWARYRLTKTNVGRYVLEGAEFANDGEVGALTRLGTFSQGPVRLGSGFPVFLPEEQTVVPLLPGYPTVSNLAEELFTLEEFTSVAGWVKPVAFTFNRDGLIVYGNAGGRVALLIGGLKAQSFGAWPATVN